MKRIISMLLICLPMLMAAQTDKNMSKYMAGAVPLVNGYVIFHKDYKAAGMTKSQIYDKLKAFADKFITGENQLEQTRITMADENEGLINLSVEEWLYFKKSALVTDRTRFFYQLILQCKDGEFSVEMRRIHYIYEDERVPDGLKYNAEEWITDKEAINAKKNKLNRINGKFRRFTIDRKNEIFKQAAISVRGVQTKTKQVTVSVDEDE